MKVLVINQWSTNKGDRAVLFFVLRELVKNGVENITVSASAPEYWKDKSEFPDIPIACVPSGWDKSRKKNAGFLTKVIHRVKILLQEKINYPLVRNALIADKHPWYLPLIVNKQYLRAVAQTDLVISSGGHRLTTINTADTVGPQAFDMAVALISKKTTVLWSQSIGTFNFKSPKNKLMIQRILQGVDHIFIRDDASAEEIRKMNGPLEKVSKTCESVFGLYDVVKTRIKPSLRPQVMGISIYPSNKKTVAQYNEYIACIKTLVDHAINSGYRVRFFPMELEGTDRPCIEAIIDAVEKKEACEIVEGFPCTPDHINEISNCRIFVGHKTHSVIFSLVASTPLLAIAYHKKTEDFMAQFTLSDYCIADAEFGHGRPDPFNAKRLIEIFDRINMNLNAISEKQGEVAIRLCLQTQQDFAKMITQLNTGQRNVP